MSRIAYALAASLVALAPVALSAQEPATVPLPVREPDDPPMVRVWTANGPNIHRNGEPIRITFESDRDAFVVVGRVDAGGEVTILYPRRPNEQTAIFGGTRYFVDAKPFVTLTSWAGGSYGRLPISAGYVFAIASDEPLDLSRFQAARGNAWKTNLGFVMANYTLQRFDAERMIEAIADDILFDRKTLFGYDLEYFALQGMNAYRRPSCWGLFCPGYANTWAAFCAISYYNYLPLAFNDCMTSGFLYPNEPGARRPHLFLRPGSRDSVPPQTMKPPTGGGLRPDTVGSVAPKDDPEPAKRKVPTTVITMDDELPSSEMDRLRRIGGDIGTSAGDALLLRRGVRRVAPEGGVRADAAGPQVYRGTPPRTPSRVASGEPRIPDYAQRRGREGTEPRAVAAPRTTPGDLPRYNRPSTRRTAQRDWGSGTGGGTRADATPRRTPGELDRGGRPTSGSPGGESRPSGSTGGETRTAAPTGTGSSGAPIRPSGSDRPIGSSSGGKP